MSAISGAARTGWQPRATRVPVHAPVQYRCVGEHEWVPSSSVNVSRSGILFIVSGPLALPPAEILVAIYLSRATVKVSGVRMQMPDLFCAGRLARITEYSDGRTAAAMQIDREWSGRAPSWAPVFFSTATPSIAALRDRQSTRNQS